MGPGGKLNLLSFFVRSQRSKLCHFDGCIPCEQSQFSSLTGKIDSAVFVFCFVE